MSNRGELEIQRMLENLGTNPDIGLSEVEAYKRLRKFGTNELERPYLLFRQMRITALFFLAAGIVLIAKGAPWYALITSVMGIGLMLWASAFRMRCRKMDIASLDQVPCICLGIRSGRLLELPVHQLVTGDIVRLQAGEIVPADGRLLEAVNLAIQEEIFSGTDEPVEKDALQPNNSSARTEDSINRVFMNTMVIRGRGTFVVTETGKNTQIAKTKLTEKQRLCEENTT